MFRPKAAADFPVRAASTSATICSRRSSLASFFRRSRPKITLSVIFGRDLLKQEARDERLNHMVALVLAALTGKSAAAFGKKKTQIQRSPAQHTA